MEEDNDGEDKTLPIHMFEINLKIVTAKNVE